MTPRTDRSYNRFLTTFKLKTELFFPKSKHFSLQTKTLKYIINFLHNHVFNGMKQVN